VTFLSNAMPSRPLISFEKITEGHPFFVDTDGYPDWSQRFPKPGPLKLEIGFGNGNFILEMAVREPDSNFIAMDFYHKGIRKTIMRLDRLKIPNVQIAYGNARERIPYLFRSGELSEVIINFPDPWPKKRHTKRRLIKPDFIEMLTDKLAPEGLLRVATDFQPYADEIHLVLSEEQGLIDQNSPKGFSHTRDSIPKSKYEKNFLNAGKTISYFEYRKDPDYTLTVPKTLTEMGPASIT